MPQMFYTTELTVSYVFLNWCMIWHLARLVDKWFMLLKSNDSGAYSCDEIWKTWNAKYTVILTTKIQNQQVLYKHSTDAHPDLPQTALNYFPTSSRHAYSKPISRSLPQIHNSVVVLYIKWVLNEETCRKTRTEKKGLTTNSKHLIVVSRFSVVDWDRSVKSFCSLSTFTCATKS